MIVEVWQRSGRREREVRVAAGLQQDGQFLVDPAPVAVRAGVAEGPVAVNEAVDDLAGCGIFPQQAVAVKERLPEAVELFAELVGGVVGVVEVDVDVAVAGVAQFLEVVEVFRPVLVLRKEERGCWGGDRRSRGSGRRAGDTLVTQRATRSLARSWETFWHSGS